MPTESGEHLYLADRIAGIFIVGFLLVVFGTIVRAIVKEYLARRSGLVKHLDNTYHGADFSRLDHCVAVSVDLAKPETENDADFEVEVGLSPRGNVRSKRIVRKDGHVTIYHETFSENGDVSRQDITPAGGNIDLSNDIHIDREESIFLVMPCFRETMEELTHGISTVYGNKSIRLFLVLDGLQHTPIARIKDVVARDIDPEETLEGSLNTLLHLKSILYLGGCEQTDTFGCLRLIGSIPERNVPFELYIKLSVPRSKRTSHTVILDILTESEKVKPIGCECVTFMDGDTGVEPGGLTLMLQHMKENNLGGIGPEVMPVRVTSYLMLLQLLGYIEHANTGTMMANFQFCFPLNGMCAMYAKEALWSIKDRYTQPSRATHILDSVQKDLGDDFFLSRLILTESSRRRTAVTDRVFMSTFIPENLIDLLAQRSRWLRCGMNLFPMVCNMKSWYGGRALLWPLSIFQALQTPIAGAGTGFILMALMLEFYIREIGVDLYSVSNHPRLLMHAAFFSIVLLYGALVVGKEVKQRRMTHTIFAVVFILLSAALFTQLFLLTVKGWVSWWLPVIVCFFASILNSPRLYMLRYGVHRLRYAWAMPLNFCATFGLLGQVFQIGIAGYAAFGNNVTGGWGTRMARSDIKEGLKKKKDINLKTSCSEPIDLDTEHRELAQLQSLRASKGAAVFCGWLAANYIWGALVIYFGYEVQWLWAMGAAAVSISLLKAMGVINYMCIT